MTGKERRDRKKMVACMEYIARQLNDEEILVGNWLSLGVADGDIEYGNLDEDDIEEYYVQDETFAELMTTFLNCMEEANESGGLYCGGVVSK
jgi:hypothetical protein